ncbi:hypothetical protein ASG22_18545 [Chryseobacterium sp. Leaf405]|uniref:hypothetical protein n=1 Tax=Chryseobacterium sp. Leaf405 TaxID=1736367 RepID=UPI0006FF060C|nr:hypothetical protein [Chryseobacterium sp. Leaf405]KQT31523.1 hypothetical protein ASG22_18545 [Chryseobacterium sp. Leaf405]
MNKKTISLKDNVLKLNFGSLKSRSYAVSIKYFDGESSSLSKRVDYKNKIFITPKQDSYLLDIDKSSLWFNGHEPDLMYELISRDLSHIVYPVQVKSNEQLTFLEITNFSQIVNNRWHHNKSNLTEKYPTKIVQSFYKAFEKNLEKRSVFEKSMQYDWFWNLLFHPKYIDYSSDHVVKTNFYLAVVPYEFPVKFTGTQKITTEITDHHSVEIHFKSDEMMAHNYFISQINKNNINSGNLMYMRLNVYFDLDVYHLFPMHTRAYFEVYSKDLEEKDTLIKRIEFTQYQEDTEDNKTAPPEKRSPYLVYEEDEKEIYKTYEGKNYTYQEWKKFEDEQYKIYTEKKTKKSFWDFLG